MTQTQPLFQRYEIRAVVDFGTHIISYLGEPQWDRYIGASILTPKGAADAALSASGGRPVFWTIYGIDQDHQTRAIGDFDSFEAALTILHAILVPFRRALDGPHPISDIEDILNQSSNDERL